MRRDVAASPGACKRLIGQIKTFTNPDDPRLRGVRVIVVHSEEEAKVALQRISDALNGELPQIANGVLNLFTIVRSMLVPSF